MERWVERLVSAEKALTTLQEIIREPVLAPVERDAANHRFEYTFEAVWKAAQAFLTDVHGLSCNSPRTALRGLGQIGILDSLTTTEALVMLDDRNLTTHTYIEAVAVDIATRLSAHAELLASIVRGLRVSMK